MKILCEVPILKIPHVQIKSVDVICLSFEFFLCVVVVVVVGLHSNIVYGTNYKALSTWYRCHIKYTVLLQITSPLWCGFVVIVSGLYTDLGLCCSYFLSLFQVCIWNRQQMRCEDNCKHTPQTAKVNSSILMEDFNTYHSI